MFDLSVGNGCTRVIRPQSVSCVRTSRPPQPSSMRWWRYQGSDVTTCTWKDGRVGVYNALLKADPKLPVLELTGSSGTASTGPAANYDGLIVAIAEFFHTGRSPVPIAETLEVLEFMTAAQISKDKGGAAVKLADLRR